MNYNKKFQIIFSVDLTTYKKEAKYLRIYNKNTKIIKLYTKDTDELLFESKITGKNEYYGKEYDKGVLIFEGEHKNAKRNGKGKLYRKGEIIFEGIYLDGKEWEGKGLIPAENTKYEFYGTISGGKINGEGKKFIKGEKKVIYEGNFVNSKRKRKRI